MNTKGSIDKCGENIEDKSRVVIGKWQVWVLSVSAQRRYIYKLSPKCCHTRI